MNITEGSSNYGLVGYYAAVVTNKQPYYDGFFCFYDEAKIQLAAYIGAEQSVSIPNSVVSVGERAFRGCKDLKSVTIGTGVQSVGKDAFNGCSSLSKLILLPNTMPTGLIDALPSGYNRITFVANDNYSGNFFGTIKKYDYLSSKFEAGGIVYVPVSPSERTCAAIDCTYSKDVKDIVIGKTVKYKGVEMKVVEINPKVLDENNSVESVNVSAEADIQQSFAHNCANIKVIELKNSGSIGSGAFERCSGLQTLNVSNTVTNIESGAFRYSMTGVTDGIIMLENAGSIGSRAFDGCSGLQILNVGNTVTDINDYAFSNAMTKSDNAQITLNNTGSIGTDAFSHCTNLQTANLSETITAIGANAFENCTSLQTINIPEAVTAIECFTFYNCQSLADIVLPEALTVIKECAFMNAGLTSIVIPSATTIIGDKVFNGCKSLAMLEVKDGKDNLDLMSNVTSLSLLFHDCPLQEVKIGRNLVYNTSQSSGYSPFYRNATLEKVTLTDVPTEVFTNEFYGCTALKEVNIGDGVTKIGDYAFSGCSALESFAFGASVEEIGKEAFSDCTAMTRLYAEPATPPTCGTQALDDINKWECTLYVKGEAKSKYMAASQWKEFFFMEEYGDFVNGVAAPEQDTMPRKDAKAYNLNGQRVRPDRKGIYIIDGKKVIVQ